MKIAPKLLGTLVISTLMISCTGKQSDDSSNEKGGFISIGTGGVTGVYYPTGGAIAKMINEKSEYGIKASAESTAGSIFNINAVMNGDLEFGIVQSDAQYFAVRGEGEWEGKGPQSKLRSICSFHSEAVTLVAAEESGVKSVADLKGKRVNIGNPGSGQRANAIDVLGTAGIDFENDLKAESLKSSESPKMLQDGRIDAFFFTVGHPSGTITEATSGKRRVRFVPITGMESLLASLPYYSVAQVPADAYPQAVNGNEAVNTIGVKATFVTSSDVSDDIVYALTKEIFENLDSFKQQHPAFAGLTKENMLEALSAPIHPGAQKYYVEAGLK